MFTSYEQLKAKVEERRQSILTLEIEVGADYSQEHEDAKKELAKAEGMTLLAGGQQFLGDNVDKLRARVAETKPPTDSIWVQFSRISLEEFQKLTSASNLTPIDQYERVLPKTFIGLFGQDPVEAAEKGEPVEPLTKEAYTVSSRHPDAVISGPGLQPVIAAFMAWQNSSGDVSIRPTKSGRV